MLCCAYADASLTIFAPDNHAMKELPELLGLEDLHELFDNETLVLEVRPMLYCSCCSTVYCRETMVALRYKRPPPQSYVIGRDAYTNRAHGGNISLI